MKTGEKFAAFIRGIKMTFDPFGYFGVAAGTEQLHASAQRRRELIEYAVKPIDPAVPEQIGDYWRKVGGYIENAMDGSMQ